MEGDGLHAEGIASYSGDVTWGYWRGCLLLGSCPDGGVAL